MKRLSSAMIFVMAAGAAMAQQKGAPADFATSVKNKYTQNKGYILQSAEKMSEDGYNWRPMGLQTELRTFGQLLVHIANENNTQCARATGRVVPPEMDDQKMPYTKAQASKIVADSFATCDPVFESLTNQNLNDMVKMPGRAGITTERARGTTLINDLTHSNEQYGMIMIYFAIRGMTPVSHEKK